MLGTSTHDTKRSEDVRLRIAALSEISDSGQSHPTLEQAKQEVSRLRSMISARPSAKRGVPYLSNASGNMATEPLQTKSVSSIGENPTIHY